MLLIMLELCCFSKKQKILTYKRDCVLNVTVNLYFLYRKTIFIALKDIYCHFTTQQDRVDHVPIGIAFRFPGGARYTLPAFVVTCDRFTNDHNKSAPMERCL